MASYSFKALCRQDLMFLRGMPAMASYSFKALCRGMLEYA
jgi:hypothetical protein